MSHFTPTFKGATDAIYQMVIQLPMLKALGMARPGFEPQTSRARSEKGNSMREFNYFRYGRK